MYNLNKNSLGRDNGAATLERRMKKVLHNYLPSSFSSSASSHLLKIGDIYSCAAGDTDKRISVYCRAARFFLVHYTKSGKSKLAKNIPNGRNIYQMAVK
jgi:hypothetical protein